MVHVGKKVDLEAGSQLEESKKAEFQTSQAGTSQHPVILQVELATKGQARVLQWVVWVLLLLLFALSIIIFTRRGSILGGEGKPLRSNYYTITLAFASLSMVNLLGWGALFLLRVVRAEQQHRLWSKRQLALAVDATVQLAAQVMICVFWIIPTALVVSSTCVFPGRLVAIMAVVRWIFFSGLLMWLLVMMHGMTRRQHGGQSTSLPQRQVGVEHQDCDLDMDANASGSYSDELSHAYKADSSPPQPPCPTQTVLSQDNPQQAHHHPLTEGAANPQAAQCPVGGGVEGGGGVSMGRGAGPGDEAAKEVSGLVAARGGCVEVKKAGGGLQLAVPPAATAAGVVGAPAAPAASRASWSVGSVAAAIIHDLVSQVPKLGRVESGFACSAEGGGPAGCQLVIDGSWGEQARAHWPKLLLWGVLLVVMVLQTARQLGSAPVVMGMSKACMTTHVDSCELAARDEASSVLFVVLVLLYVLMYYMYMYRAFRDHASLPYSHYRLTNIYIRVQLRHTSVALGAVAFTMLVDLGLGVNSCTAYLDSQMGSFPMQIALVQMVLVSSFLYLPATSLGAPLVQSMLQQFSWTEAGLPSLRRRRNAELASWLADEPTLEQRLLPALLPHLVPSAEEAGAGAEAALAREPVFCMERAVRLFYWSKLAYQYGNPQSIVTETTALRLFGLDQCKCIYEPSTNIRGLVGYGAGSTIVLCFRGTDGLKNVWTDIRSHLVLHAPKRRVQGQVVRVHGGFYSAWRQGGFRERVLEAVREVVEGGQAAGEGLTLHLTGHSLGGALAVLAAYDLRSHHPAARISVYTFGAPRVGSRAWYLDYSAAVPDTWGIINSQDPIPRIPKLFYKRCGERVTVNPRGDIIVRPSYFELSVINTSGGTVTHHMLWSYSLSLAAVIKAQFLPSKRLPGNQSGVRGLVSALDLGEALLLHNMDLKALQDPALPPKLMRVTRPKAARKLSGTLAGCSCAPWLPSGLSQQEGLQINAQEDEEEEEENGDVGIGLEDDKDARS